MIERKRNYPKYRNTPDKYIIEYELLWGLYWGEELSTIKIAKLFGCNRDTINFKMRTYNIPRRNVKDTNRNRKIVIPKEELEKLYNQKEMTIEKISDLYGCSSSVIYYLMKDYNIPIKNRGEFTVWNEGTKGLVKPNSGSFKKGLIPWNKGMILLHDLICKQCGIPFKNRNKLKKYCSKECYLSSIQGKNSRLWKGGRSLIEDELRHSRILREWRTKIVKRDNYTCQFCHDTHKRMHAHHIKSWKDFPEDRFKLENGICLCIPCHIYIHKIDILSQQ